MVLKSEIKDFTKNTLILTLFFSLVLQLSWGYIGTYFGFASSSGRNEETFKQANQTYLGNIATAVSLNVGQKTVLISGTPVSLANETISIAEALSDPKGAQKKLIADNMAAINTYMNVLRTDIPALLDNSNDRANALDEHIDILKDYFARTTERLSLMSEQIVDLQTILASSRTTVNTAKDTMQQGYMGFDAGAIDSAIDDYMTAKQSETKANTYLVFLQKFQRSYIVLQAQNKKIMDALSLNRDALIKRTQVVIPNAGADILKQMNIITKESDLKKTDN